MIGVFELGPSGFARIIWISCVDGRNLGKQVVRVQIVHAKRDMVFAIFFAKLSLGVPAGHRTELPPHQFLVETLCTGNKFRVVA